MAEIVSLQKWRDENPTRIPLRLDTNAVPAELHFFMGVRYERIEDLGHHQMDELALSVEKH